MRTQGILGLLGLVGIALALSGCEAMICTVAAESSPWGQHCKAKAIERESEAAEQRLRVAPPESLSIWYVNTQGKVGYHMVAEPRARCGADWSSNSPSLTGGSLPPGLRLRGSRIEGVPQSPGRWQARVSFSGIACRGRSYPDQTVHVDLSIEGDAPRRVR
jgi:hypothetical protein